MYDRHHLLLRDVIILNQNGYKLRDLAAIFELLDLCAEKLKHAPNVYKEHVMALIRLCKFPFLKELSSDEQRYLELTQSCLSQLGRLLHVTDEDVRLEVCRSLEGLYEPADALSMISEVATVLPVSSSFLRAAVEGSTIVDSLTAFQLTVTDFRQSRLLTLRILQTLSMHSATCSRKLITAGLPKSICSTIRTKLEPHHPLLSLCTGILLNCIGHEHSPETVREWVNQVGDETSLEQLQEVLFYLLAQSHSKAARSLRNDVLAVIVLLIKNAASINCLEQLHVVETGLVEKIVQLITFGKVGSHDATVRNLKFAPNPENFEMLKMAVSTLALLARSSAFVQVRVLLVFMSQLTTFPKVFYYGILSGCIHGISLEYAGHNSHDECDCQVQTPIAQHPEARGKDACL
ncbi:unnamed protein product [Dicrocoelium dendriticum]|nr:unnamed protein product [Dicrocoelium dendriticum]